MNDSFKKPCIIGKGFSKDPSIELECTVSSFSYLPFEFHFGLSKESLQQDGNGDQLKTSIYIDSKLMLQFEVTFKGDFAMDLQVIKWSMSKLFVKIDNKIW